MNKNKNTGEEEKEESKGEFKRIDDDQRGKLNSAKEKQQ